ncbi:MAG: hypothetical protein AAGN64_10680, partial [Bacteroidota bacterium]
LTIFLGLVIALVIFLVSIIYTENMLFTNETYVMIAFVMIIIPFVNGVVDWVSWAVSRLLGGHLLKKPGRVRSIVHAAIDFGLAIVLLGVLIWVLVGSLAIGNRLARIQVGHDLVDISRLLDLVESDPLGGGFWVTVMLFSTLIPTVLHLAVAFYGLVRLPLRVEKRATHYSTLRALRRGEKKDLSLTESDAIARYLFWNQRMVAVALTLFSVGIGVWLLSNANHVADLLFGIARNALAVVG